MYKQIVDGEMEKYAKDYVWGNNTYFLNMMDRWIQRTDYRFPLDIKVLEENASMSQERSIECISCIFLYESGVACPC